MAETGNATVTLAERMEILKNSAQQRVLNAPMPTAVMEQLLADGKAHALGRFEHSPVQYMGRWWRSSDVGWAALDEAASAQLDLHPERYRAAAADTGLAPPAGQSAGHLVTMTVRRTTRDASAAVQAAAKETLNPRVLTDQSREQFQQATREALRYHQQSVPEPTRYSTPQANIT